MDSGSKLNEALQIILNNLNGTNSADVDTQAIETENAQLRQKQLELMAKLNRHSTVNSSIILIKDMLLRQQTINQARSESKKQLTARFKIRLQEAAAQVVSRKQKLQEVDKFMTLPYNQVKQKILEMEKKLDENRSKINALIPEYKKLSLIVEDKAEEGILQLRDTLSCVEEEQRNLLEKYKQK